MKATCRVGASFLQDTKPCRSWLEESCLYSLPVLFCLFCQQARRKRMAGLRVLSKNQQGREAGCKLLIARRVEDYLGGLSHG